jgi:hypothetical protein
MTRNESKVGQVFRLEIAGNGEATRGPVRHYSTSRSVLIVPTHPSASDNAFLPTLFPFPLLVT